MIFFLSTKVIFSFFVLFKLFLKNKKISKFRIMSITKSDTKDSNQIYVPFYQVM